MGSGGFFWYVGRSVGFFIKKDIARGRGVQMDCHRWQEGWLWRMLFGSCISCCK